MSRYIDADEVLEQIRKKLDIKSLSYLLEAERQIVNAIQSAPSIDIAFCKECKHRPIKEDADGENYGFNLIEPTKDDDRCPCLVDDGWFSWMPEDDFYCGYGERGSEKLNNSTTEQSPVVGKE